CFPSHNRHVVRFCAAALQSFLFSPHSTLLVPAPVLQGAVPSAKDAWLPARTKMIAVPLRKSARHGGCVMENMRTLPWSN
ncbi:MAG: hypothetical protein RLO38_18420, partial [Roseovarius confluentis]